jgi:hypothetical protein
MFAGKRWEADVIISEIFGETPEARVERILVPLYMKGEYPNFMGMARQGECVPNHIVLAGVG